MNITEFEQRVIDQKPVESGHYDSEYFTGDWRAEGNNYNLETRRQIEAKNPSLIRDVFQPARVLDLFQTSVSGARLQVVQPPQFRSTPNCFLAEVLR